MVWTLIEPGIAIVAASMATIRPLLRRMRIRGFESTDNPSTYGHNSAWSSSRKAKPKPGFMLQDDVDLEDLDTKPMNRTEVTLLSHGEINKSLPNIPRLDVRPGAVPDNSEGAKRSPAANSFEQIHELEEQRQDDALGLSKRAQR